MLGIQIFRDRSHGILGLTQKANIDKVFSRLDMKDCAPGDTPLLRVINSVCFNAQGMKLRRKKMENIPYLKKKSLSKYIIN